MATSVNEEMKKYQNPLVKDLLTAAAFILVGVLLSGSPDPMVTHFVGASIGFGFGFAIRAIIAYRKKQ